MYRVIRADVYKCIVAVAFGILKNIALAVAVNRIVAESARYRDAVYRQRRIVAAYRYYVSFCARVDYRAARTVDYRIIARARVYRDFRAVIHYAVVAGPAVKVDCTARI